MLALRDRLALRPQHLERSYESPSRLLWLDDIIDIANHYYELRNKFVHERATVDVGDRDIGIYRTAVERVLNTLFNLEFER